MITCHKRLSTTLERAGASAGPGVQIRFIYFVEGVNLSESDQVIFPPCKVALWASPGVISRVVADPPPCKCGEAQQRRWRQSNLNHLAVAKNQSTGHSQLSSHRQHELSCCRWRRTPTAGRGLERSKAARCVAAHARALIDTIFPRI